MDDTHSDAKLPMQQAMPRGPCGADPRNGDSMKTASQGAVLRKSRSICCFNFRGARLFLEAAILRFVADDFVKAPAPIVSFGDEMELSINCGIRRGREIAG